MIQKWFNKLPRWSHWLIAAVMCVAGAFIMRAGNQSGNPLTIAIGVAPFGFALLIIRAWFNGRAFVNSTTMPSQKPHDGKDKSKPAPNSILIKPDRIVLDYIENAFGMPHKCFNNNGFYYIYKVNDRGGLEEFTLPDDDKAERYYDPMEFANVVTMPSNKKYYTWASTTMQKVSIGVMGLVVIGLIIGSVAMGD